MSTSLFEVKLLPATTLSQQPQFLKFLFFIFYFSLFNVQKKMVTTSEEKIEKISTSAP